MNADDATTLIEEDRSAEDESDLSNGAKVAVLTGTDWTTETVLTQVRRGNILLDPRFQRREAWTPERQSRFIESLILGLPVPQLVLAERRDHRGGFLVIDGKQRLLALRHFGANATNDDFSQLKLTGLEIRHDLNGLSLEDMQGSPELSDDVSVFENQPIRTVVVRNWPDESFLYRVFLRLNTGSLPLSPQELRQALHPGPFLDFADTRSAESEPIRIALGLEKPDFRMRDVELLVRFYAFHEFLPDYRGNLKDFLDSTCKILNDRWADSESQLKNVADLCDSAISATISIFGTHAFRRWAGSRYQGPFNRAVFDVMTFYFKNPAIASMAQENAESVESAFKSLCNENFEFTASLQTTTKTLHAVVVRLSEWGSALSRAINADIRVPHLEDNRILA